MKNSYIDVLTVKAGRTSGVYLQGEVKGKTVFMPLTPEGARRLSDDPRKSGSSVRSRSENGALTRYNQSTSLRSVSACCLPHNFSHRCAGS